MIAYLSVMPDIKSLIILCLLLLLTESTLFRHSSGKILKSELKALNNSDLEKWVEARCDVTLIDDGLVQEGDTPEEAKVLGG